MEVSDKKLREYTRKIITSRMRLLCNNGFYGLLLMHMKINVSDEHETAWSDMDERLYINPDFLESISDGELDYVLMHLLLHIVLKHLGRKNDFKDEYYDRAADIVVNSNILRSNSEDLDAITLYNYGGVQEHTVPSGDDGWKYSVEEVYQMLRIMEPLSNDDSDGDADSNKAEDPLDDEGDVQGSDDSNKVADIDAGNDTEGKNSGGKSQGKSGRKNKSKSVTGAVNRSEQNNLTNIFSELENSRNKGWDYHNSGTDFGSEDNNLKDEIWKERVMQAAFAIKRRNTGKNPGLLPAFAERYLEELKKSQMDWRTVLDEFVQEEINDYSFCPPDRRFDDSPFFLPDFNEKDFYVEKVLFMIDTSGSMDDEEIAQCYSEIKGAIDQFDGKLEGWLGFFDAVVVEPRPFVDEDDFMAIRPEGGGGTRFDIIFDYIFEHMADDLPVSIVILTDGHAPYPKESATHGIPVLWVIDNDTVTPPWGKITRIDIGKSKKES